MYRSTFNQLNHLADDVKATINTLKLIIAIVATLLLILATLVIVACFALVCWVITFSSAVVMTMVATIRWSWAEDESWRESMAYCSNWCIPDGKNDNNQAELHDRRGGDNLPSVDQNGGEVDG